MENTVLSRTSLKNCRCRIWKLSSTRITSLTVTETVRPRDLETTRGYINLENTPERSIPS